MKTDGELLDDFTARRNEASFRQVVERHIGFVHAVNLRRLRNGHLAEEATQSVFIALSRKAAAVARCPSVIGWLHRSSCYESRNLMRAQLNRTARESEAERLGTTTGGAKAAANHGELEAVLDEVMNELPETDRDAVLARFFSGCSFAEIGAATGRTENAARMRVDRALDRLRDRLERRGFQSTAAVLAGALPAYAAAAVPPGLAAIVGSASLASLGAGAAAFSFFAYMNTTKLVTAVVAVAAAGVIGFEVQQNHKLQRELGDLRQQQVKIAEAMRGLEQKRVSAPVVEQALPPPVAAPAVAAAPVRKVKADVPGLTRVAPAGWYKNGSKNEAYDVGVDPSQPFGGVPSAYAKSISPDAEKAFGGMMQTIAADQYKTGRVRLSGWIKTEDVGEGGGHLWLRVDSATPGKMLGFDNMQQRGPKGTTDWTEYSIVLDVPRDATNVNYGFFIQGSGQMWVNGMNVEAVGAEVPTTNMLPPTAPVNLGLNPTPKPSGG